MVNISIDVTDLGGEARAGDKVTLWSPRVAGSAFRAGGVVSTAPVTVFLTNGKATVPNVEPGDMRVLLQCRGVESQGPIPVTVPDSTGTVTLRSLIEAQFEYSPPIVSAVQQAADNAAASERAAIQAQVRSEAAADRAEARVDEAINNGAELVRAEVKQDADRAVSARQAATQSESSAAASEDAAASSASNAATSETNAKQSEDNAGDYAAVATTAATEAVDAMERATDLAGGDFATHEYVDSAVANVPRVDTTVGTRVFVGSQMIFGDTGLRRLARWDSQGVDIPDALKDFAPAEENLSSNPGGIWIRRQNNTVTLYVAYAKALKGNPEMRPSPVGFGGQAYTGLPFPAAPLGYSLGGTLTFSTIEIGLGFFRFRVPKDAAIRTVGTGGYGVEITWHTRENWPPSLPGTPA